MSSLCLHLLFFFSPLFLLLSIPSLHIFYSPFLPSTCNKQTTDEGVSLSRCSRCEVAHYCSVACQKTHWKAGHKQQCA